MPYCYFPFQKFVCETIIYYLYKKINIVYTFHFAPYVWFWFQKFFAPYLGRVFGIECWVYLPGRTATGDGGCLLWVSLQASSVGTFYKVPSICTKSHKYGLFKAFQRLLCGLFGAVCYSMYRTDLPMIYGCCSIHDRTTMQPEKKHITTLHCNIIILLYQSIQ